MNEPSDRPPWEDTELTLLSRDELEDLVRRRTAALENVTDAMVDVLLKLDADGRIELANPAVRSTLGYDPDAIVGQPIDALLASSEERFAGRELLSSGEFGGLLVRRGEVPDVEVAFSAADGSILPMSLSTSAITDDEQRVDGFVCVARDLSERLERERILTRTNEQLELLNQLVRHDIRNDASLVLELAQRLRSAASDADGPLVLDDRERRYLERIVDSGDRIIDLTTSARQLMEAFAEVGVDRKPVDLEAILRREIANATILSQDASVTVSDPIPEVSVLANEMLASVFRNLLANAIQHNDKPRPEVTVSTTVTDTDVTVRIADTGPGLPDEVKSSLREGTRSLATARPTGPNGYGLYLVGTLLEQYDGHLDVEDNDPHGTTFEVTLTRDESERS